MSTLKYNENIFDFLPVSGNEQKAITLYQDITGGQRIVAMFKMSDGDSTDVDLMTAAVDTFANKIETGYGRHHIKDITTQVDFEKIAGITDFIYHNMPFMLTDSDYVRMEQQLSSPHYADSQLAHDVEMIMKKKLTKTEEGIKVTNLLEIAGEEKEVKFEQVESYYYLFGKYIVCPKGSYHPYDFTNKEEIKPDEKFIGENWDLRCYKHSSGFFLVFYLMVS
jgi:hypothetical protein